MKKKKGFTLVELIAVIGITVIFGAIVLGISITSGKLFSMTQSQSVFNDEARLIISTLEEDLRKNFSRIRRQTGYGSFYKLLLTGVERIKIGHTNKKYGGMS